MTGARCLVTTVVRTAQREQRTGWVHVVDVDAGTALACYPAPPSPLLRAQQAARRGARGVSVHEDRVVVANSAHLFVLDTAWRVQWSFTHPLVGSIHDVLAVAEGIWVSCVNADLLALVSWEGELVDTWTWRSDRRLARSLGYLWAPRFARGRDYRHWPVTQHLTNRVHLNAVTADGDDLLVALGRVLAPGRVRRRGLIPYPLRIRRENGRPVGWPTGKVLGSAYVVVRVPGLRTGPGGAHPAEVVLEQRPTRVPNHNLLLLPEQRLAYNDTNTSEVVVVDMRTHSELVRTRVGGKAPFARGLARLDDDHLLAGSQKPASLYVIRISDGAIVRSIEVTDRRDESVYGIAVLPPGMASPPESMDWWASPDDAPAPCPVI